jgi:hypothetical protein
MLVVEKVHLQAGAGQGLEIDPTAKEDRQDMGKRGTRSVWSRSGKFIRQLTDHVAAPRSDQDKSGTAPHGAIPIRSGQVPPPQHEKKMFFRQNELSYLLQIQDLTFLKCEKRTGF